MPFLQDIIHKFEEGGGTRYVRWGVIALLVFSFTVAYNLRAFRNMGTEEAMDSAQLARNIAEGKGYSTSFIRPFSIYLIKKRNLETGRHETDIAQLRGNHPDIANPPVYPLVLAGLLKVVPLDYTVQTATRFWSKLGQFQRYKPDFLISAFNQLLFFVLIVSVFYLARRLFDAQVAWLSAVILFGTELLWRFSVSGLSTMLLMLIFSGLIWVLVLTDEEARATASRPGRLLLLGLLAGLTVGVGALTRYSFALLIIPVLVYLILFGGKNRAGAMLAALAAFLVVFVPWVVRNEVISGTPFGISTYAFMANHPNEALFTGNRLERSLDPLLERPFLIAVTWHKFFVNLKPILQSELPRLGGSWLSAFFLVGLMVPFRKESTRQVRYFLLACIPLFIIAQAVGRTHLSEDSPELNSENLLVLLAPFVVVYGVSLFFVLLDQMPLPLFELRYAVIVAFALLMWLPTLLVFFPPATVPIAYPPYSPPMIEVAAKEAKPNELVMTDIPWAMAWYGRRQAVWTTLRPLKGPTELTSTEDFFAINDLLKPITVLYLTPMTIDRRFLSQWFQSGEQAWGEFLVSILMNKRVPSQLPLKNPLDPFVADPRLPRTERLSKLETALKEKINLIDQATQELLKDPKVADAVKESKDAEAFMTLTSGRDFPLGRVPTPDERALELMILRGQLILTSWAR